MTVSCLPVISIANIASHILGYWLTPWSRFLFKMLIVHYLVKKFPGFYGTRKSTAVFTSAHHLLLCSARPISPGPPILLLKHNKHHLTEMWLSLQCEGTFLLSLQCEGTVLLSLQCEGRVPLSCSVTDQTRFPCSVNDQSRCAYSVKDQSRCPCIVKESRCPCSVKESRCACSVNDQSCSPCSVKDQFRCSCSVKDQSRCPHVPRRKVLSNTKYVSTKIIFAVKEISVTYPI